MRNMAGLEKKIRGTSGAQKCTVQYSGKLEASQ